MEIRNDRTYCTQDEFMKECSKYFLPGDTIDTGIIDDQEALIFRNSAKCKLSSFIVKSGEYRVY